MKIILTILLSLFLCKSFAQPDKALTAQGNILYKQQSFEKAAEAYKKAIEKNEKNAEAQYNLGNALYKNKKPDEAVKAYEGAAGNSDDKTMKSKAGYNKGVMYSRQNKLPESIQAYKDALKQNSEDDDARENLQKALNELKKQQQKPQPENKKQNKKQQDDQQKDEPQKNKSDLNEKQAERYLNTLRQEEKKIQQNLQNKQVKGGGLKKDW